MSEQKIEKKISTVLKIFSVTAASFFSFALAGAINGQTGTAHAATGNSQQQVHLISHTSYTGNPGGFHIINHPVHINNSNWHTNNHHFVHTYPKHSGTIGWGFLKHPTGSSTTITQTQTGTTTANGNFSNNAVGAAYGLTGINGNDNFSHNSAGNIRAFIIGNNDKFVVNLFVTRQSQQAI